MLQHVYVICLALSLTLHVFNMGGGDGLKPFHIPAAIACVLSFILAPKRNKVFWITMGFLFIALISSLLSYSDSAIVGWINIFIVITSCYGLAFIRIDNILKLLIVLIPIDLVVLVIHAIQEPVYRYQGYYNDPNYLCTTLIVFLFVCLFTTIYEDNEVIKKMQLINVLLIIPLFLMTLSRTGITCCLIIISTILYGTLKRHPIKFFLLMIVFAFAVHHYAAEFVNQQWGLLYERIFETNDNFENAGNYRGELSLQNLRFIKDNPQYAFLGLGAGTTKGDGAIHIPGLMVYRHSSTRDHNTWTSCISEQGILAFLFFVALIGKIAITIFSQKASRMRNLIICTFFSLILFSLSIYQMTYLPFWWMIFLFLNKNMYNKIKAL